MLSNNRTLPIASPSPANNETMENPPEYTEATTSFMGGDDNAESGTSDTDPLVTPPPPYVP